MRTSPPDGHCVRYSQLWDLTTLAFWSDNSQTLPEAPSDRNTFCWCSLDAVPQAWEHIRVPVTMLGMPTTNLGVWAACLGAPRIIVVQFRKNNIFFGLAGAPGTYSYYLLFNDCWNSNIQYVFSSMYRYIYVSISLSIYTWYIWIGRRRWLRQNRGVPEANDPVITDTIFEAMIDRVWRCSGRPRLCKLGGCDWASLDMHLWSYNFANLEAVMERVSKCTLMPWSSELRDVPWGHGQLSFGMRLEAMVKQDWWGTWMWLKGGIPGSDEMLFIS